MGYNNQSRRNWAEEYEDEKDKRRERNLNHRVSSLIEEIDNMKDTKLIIKKLEEARKIFHSLYSEGFEYDEKDKNYVNKKLSELKYKELEEKYKAEGGDHDSWAEYKKEEEDLEK